MIAIQEPATEPQADYYTKLYRESCDLMIEWVRLQPNAEAEERASDLASIPDADHDAAIDRAIASGKRALSEKISLMKRHVEKLRGDVAALRPTIETAGVIHNGTVTYAKAPVELEAGIYLLDGEIFKVRRAVHGSGHMYARALDVTDKTPAGKARFSRYVAGAMKKLTADHKMTKAQAVEFGQLYGMCVNCGATLTDDTSIERAMGPVCASKF